LGESLWQSLEEKHQAKQSPKEKKEEEEEHSSNFIGLHF
jgi:hypothetical protein